VAWIGFLSVIALLTLALLAARWFLSASARDLAQALRVFVATFAGLLGSGLIYAGRFGFAIAALGAAAYAVRSFRKAQRPPGSFGPAEDMAGHDDEATVTTATLAMRVDPATGHLDGDVRRGRFRGRRLARLSLAELEALLDDCRREDPESEPLVEAYLDRRHPGWRGGDAPGGRPGGGEPAMSDARALEILGLEAGAGEDAIKEAHRRLMAHLHPDRGGSTYLAAQLNAARQHLLGRRQRG
jgi:hypothetical protein